MTSPWSFAVWRIDLIGQLLKGRGSVQYAVVAIDYFTKWVEAEALASITPAKIKKFVYKNIIYHCRVPHTIVSDNDKQFDCGKFKEFCDNLQIKKVLSSVARLQANGQVEAINKTIKHNLKTKLEELKGRWADELSEVHLAYRTTVRTLTRGNPVFAHVWLRGHGSDGNWGENYDSGQNFILQKWEIDFLEEKRHDS